MPLSLGNIEFPAEEYTLYAEKNKIIIVACAPNKADAEDMLTWLAKAFGLLPP